MSIDYSGFKIPKPTQKRRKKRKDLTDIPTKVKTIVWERDSHKCIFCGKVVPRFYANAHFIPRSAGGLGIPENIFTACDNCHRKQDNGLNTKLYDSVAENYLRSIYGASWNKEKLIYNKWRKEK